MINYNCIFNSREQHYRRPFGAVSAGTLVYFTLCPPREIGAVRVALEANFELNGRTVEAELAWTALSQSRDVYTGSLDTSGCLGPVWYRFRIETTRRTVYICCLPGKTGGIGQLCESDGPWFQLTVYGGSFQPARWYGQGVTYHIFPDRFARSKAPDAKQFPDRIIHENWNDVPEYRPDESGEILNNDFFGGELAGIQDKLPYLKELGVGTIYLSPVFESSSNHRYDTGDYHRIDPMLGTNEDFTALCRAAEKMGIRVILDGVFNHTGFDSRYFNGRGSYDSVGAHQSQESPYFDWYGFDRWPDRYSSWWGIYTLPQVNELSQSYRRFIMGGRDSVARRWLRAGASGWRLDVADELPDEFIRDFRKAAKEEKPDAVIIGEVWEDASSKISYGKRRRYLLGDELDGVMNYPLRSALIGFVRGGDAAQLKETVETLRENYPKPAFFSLMNILGTHDTPRILTVLGVSDEKYAIPRDEKARFRLMPAQREMARRRLKIASLLLFAVPGSPCVYYGDEAGMEGFEDPFNRAGFPWGGEDTELTQWYRALSGARARSEALRCGELSFISAKGPLLVLSRACEAEHVLAAANRGEAPLDITRDWPAEEALDLLSGQEFRAEDGRLALTLPPCSAMLLGTPL